MRYAAANAQQRVAGDRVGINMVSTIVDTENPIMTSAGGLRPRFKANRVCLTENRLVADCRSRALQKNFPHVAALLQAIPFSRVTASSRLS